MYIYICMYNIHCILYSSNCSFLGIISGTTITAMTAPTTFVNTDASMCLETDHLKVLKSQIYKICSLMELNNIVCFSTAE